MMTADQSLAFAGLLRGARREVELTQEELAERAGISARGISDLERGIIRAPRRETLELLMAALDLPAEARASWRELREELARQPGPSKPRREQSTSTPAHGVALARTRLVGREREIVAIIALVLERDVPLLTLTGPGGVGKTRLALAAAACLEQGFPDGIWSVSLAPLTTSELVIPTLAAVFGVTEQAGRSLLELLGNRIGERQTLLVLDDCEHVVAAAADIGELLVVCPNLTILATSRVPLRVYGEREYPVSPLDLPEADSTLVPEQLAEVEAVELFVERANAVRPGFELTAENAQDVVRICRKLDGLPLALELAAARTRLFSSRELLVRLDQPLAVLAGGPRDVPARQQTLRNTIAWSYDLLDDDGQQLFRQLAVFLGGWTLEAAEAVASPEIDVVNRLEALIEHSLAQFREQADRWRYGMLETVREFALEALEARGELDQTIRRHTDYYVDLLERARLGVGPEAGQRAWWTGFQDELDNVRAVLGRAVSRGDGAVAQNLAGSLLNFWYYGRHDFEARYWLEAALALGGDAPARVRARAFISFGHVVRQFGDMELASQCALRALELYEEAGDHAGQVEALVLAGWTEIYRGNYPLARQWAEQALDGARAVGDKHITARALDTLCIAMGGHLDYERAECLCSESLALYREVGDPRNACRVLGFLGYITLLRGDLGRADDLLTQAIEQADRLGDNDQVAFISSLFGWLDLKRANYQRAYARFAESLPVHDQAGATVTITWALEGMAAAIAGLGDPLHGARLLGAAAALRERIGSPVQPWRKEQYGRDRATIHDSIGQELFLAAEAEGRSWTLEEAIEHALEWLDATEPERIAVAADTFTPRELDVLRLLVDGRSNQEIAEALFISPHTAANHVANIMSKLGVESRTAAATWAVRQGLA